MAIAKLKKVILRSLFSKSACKMYPVVVPDYPEITKGHIEINIENCIFCGICSRKCPADAITVDRGAKTWSIERMQCIQCRCCTENCPKKCLFNVNTYTAPNVVKVVDTYAAPPVEEPPAQPAAE